MKDNLKNNLEALEFLFDDEFYHVAPKGDFNAPEEKEQEKTTPIENVKTEPQKKKMSKPCMVFKSGDNPSLQKNMVELWRKILASIQLTPNSVNTVELQPGISIDHILEGKMGSPVIFWTGEDMVEDLEGFPAYEIHENEDMAFVISDSLTDISKDRDLKVKLWSVLQKMDFESSE